MMSTRAMKMFMLAFIVFAALSTASAQRFRMSVDERVKSLKDQLSLTQAQADSVKVIYENGDKEREKLFQANKGDRSAIRDAMTTLNKTLDEQVKALLTDDQKTKFEKVMKDRPRGPRPRRDQGN